MNLANSWKGVRITKYTVEPLISVRTGIVLPQGGLFRRPGFEFVYDCGCPQGIDHRLTKFSFNKSQEYVQLWKGSDLRIFRQKALVATVTTPYVDPENRTLRTAQSGDVQILAQFNHPPQRLERLGSDTDWGISEIAFDPLPFFRFNTTHDITPSVATVGVGRTFTLGISTEGYWNAGHFGNDIKIKFNSGEATLKTPQQNATGGTAYSSAGTAANAFDGSDITVVDAGVDGWIGYDFTSATVTRVVGIRMGTAANLTLSFETDDNSGFTSPTVVGTLSLSTEVDTWVYIDIPRHTGENFFRVRETGGATFSDVQQLIFNEGLVAVGDVDVAFANTNATKSWKEQGWGEHQGYPRTVEFFGNRLVFGGVRSSPNTLFFSKDGDLFNFDDTTTDADAAFARTLSTDQNHFIRDMKSDREGMVIFTSDGVFNLDGDGAPVTPTNVSIEPQSVNGVSVVAVDYQDGNLVYVESSGKSISATAYSFGADQYITDNKNTLAHHLFTEDNRPRALASIRTFRNTQANLLFVPREDGEMPVLTQDRSKQVLGWSRFVTYDPDGIKSKFRDAVVVETDHGQDDIDGNPITIPTLYVVVTRIVDGQSFSFLEALTEEDVYLDHWYIGNATNEQAVTVAINAAGSGYAVDDILSVTGGTGTAATLKVRAVGGSGDITDVAIRTGGDYTVNPTNPVSTTNVVGSGTGATFDLTYDIKPKPDWSGLVTLPNSEISVVGDGYVIGRTNVDALGNFVIPNDVTQIFAGIPYVSFGRTLKLAVVANGQVVRGRLITVKEAIMDFDQTVNFSVNNYPVYFREWEDFVFDTAGDGLDKFTGQKRVKISNIESGPQRDPKVEFKVTEPVSCTLLTLTILAKIGSS